MDIGHGAKIEVDDQPSAITLAINQQTQTFLEAEVIQIDGILFGQGVRHAK